mmetsp:Transcript_5096/g.12549  ORF Transcript_5096/g.12549 Transcript_5096/m.12549 type:complete len:206 (+) Transcript_5096:730-1347(+)
MPSTSVSSVYTLVISSDMTLNASRNRSFRIAWTELNCCVTVRKFVLAVSCSFSIESRRKLTSSYCSIAFMFGAMPSCSRASTSIALLISFSSLLASPLRASSSSRLKSIWTICSASAPLSAESTPSAPSSVEVPTSPTGEKDSEKFISSRLEGAPVLLRFRFFFEAAAPPSISRWLASTRGSLICSRVARWKMLCRVERRCSSSD